MCEPRSNWLSAITIAHVSCQTEVCIAVIEVGLSERSGSAYAYLKHTAFIVFWESLAVASRKHMHRRFWLHPHLTFSVPPLNRHTVETAATMSK